MANAARMEGLTHVQGIFNYLADTSKRPAYLVNPDRSKPVERPAQKQHTIPVYNGRDVQDQLSLDIHGLMLTKRETKVSNFYDSEEVKRVYYPEAAELVKDMTGASKVVVFDHNVRCGPRSKQGEPGVSSPVLFAHNDYTIKSVPPVSATSSPQKRQKRSCSTAFVLSMSGGRSMSRLRTSPWPCVMLPVWTKRTLFRRT